MKIITASNFTPKYDALEDRIRLSINYDDLANRVDYMITRSFILKLFPILEDYMIKFFSLDLSTVLPANNPTEEVVKSNPSTSVTDNSNLELYKQQDELLLEIKFSYVKKTKMNVLKFISKNSEANVQLNASDLKQIFTIIKDTIPFFSWGISQNF